MISYPRAGKIHERGPMMGGTWKPWLIQGSLAGVFFCCPGCGAELRLDHAVAADGTVSPSVECPGQDGKSPCGFHEFLKLDGWDFGERELQRRGQAT